MSKCFASFPANVSDEKKLICRGHLQGMARKILKYVKIHIFQN